MAELKTQRNKESVTKFLNSISPEQRRKDGLILLEMFKEITGLKPEMWGTSIVGFGSYHYKSSRSSQEGDWPLTGFSPRKTSLSLYIMSGLEKSKDLLKKLGKHKIGVGCLYINKLSDVDEKILKQIIKKSFEETKKNPQGC